MIPRIFHRIRLGGTPMPTEFQSFGDSWAELHPDWEMWDWFSFSRQSS
jgi:mannosyltransferase OCH1-like enzyme